MYFRISFLNLCHAHHWQRMQSPFTVLFAATRLKQLLRNDAARFVAAHDAVQVCVSVCVLRVQCEAECCRE